MHGEDQGPVFWFIVGALLSILGITIAATGIYFWIHPPEFQVTKFGSHVDVWMGILVAAIGLYISIRFCPWRN